MTILDVGVTLWLARQKGKLTIVRVARRIGYPLQGMCHVDTLKRNQSARAGNSAVHISIECCTYTTLYRACHYRASHSI